MQHSALYQGSVYHRRTAPRLHEFNVPIFLLYLDLAERSEFESLTRWLPISFRRENYFGDARQDLDACVRDRVEAVLQERPDGPVRMLTHASYWGYCFNPVSFYYCFDARGDQVHSILAEVTNTPWDERFSYVVGFESGKASLPKEFHVSPFIPMDVQYDWTYTKPGRTLQFSMAVQRSQQQFFEASLSLERRELTRSQLASTLVRFPWMTARVSTAIYAQALRLWSKGVRFHPHPARAE